MSLTRLMQSFKKSMEFRQYLDFIALCKQSVDLQAKNTPNRASRDLAELQIRQLANRFTTK
jgi:hypothetical protein